MDSSRLNELDVQYNCFKQLNAKSENNDFNELQYFINNSSIVIFYLNVVYISICSSDFFKILNYELNCTNQLHFERN